MLVLAPSLSSAPVPATFLFLFSPFSLFSLFSPGLSSGQSLSAPLTVSCFPLSMSSVLNHRPLPPSTPLEHITEMRLGEVSFLIKPSLSNTHSEKPSGEYILLVSCSSESIIATQGLFQSFWKVHASWSAGILWPDVTIISCHLSGTSGKGEDDTMAHLLSCSKDALSLSWAQTWVFGGPLLDPAQGCSCLQILYEPPDPSWGFHGPDMGRANLVPLLFHSIS